ncbi:hypothetical protein [Chryseobacterium chendengshani]|uniref:hypothetical protein n=1 Tax=Chryseobacterium sp. LJ756 TaxID=2864113 RepID=UPI001C643697|nr:hypothetical protein [Chryseobacterium sp. LJ756]MBW7674951.1 hypothetical protein [Chryseobacterium sp. LJ756]
MIKIERKYLFIMSGIMLILLILGYIYDANTIAMSALIGLSAGSFIQLFVHNNRSK